MHSQNHTKNVKHVINELNTELRHLNKKKFSRAPRRKALVSITKGHPSLPFMGIMAVCSETHAKFVSALCGQNIELQAFDT